MLCCIVLDAAVHGSDCAIRNKKTTSSMYHYIWCWFNFAVMDIASGESHCATTDTSTTSSFSKAVGVKVAVVESHSAIIDARTSAICFGFITIDLAIVESYLAAVNVSPSSQCSCIVVDRTACNYHNAIPNEQATALDFTLIAEGIAVDVTIYKRHYAAINGSTTSNLIGCIAIDIASGKSHSATFNVGAGSHFVPPVIVDAA
mmetsp:Transcript_59447/g.98553  ORF Transcript_59447/g.98553 Transcript_59447/m.98553 type:complete len:203 (-) Transcript_59447:635-1243(-)